MASQKINKTTRAYTFDVDVISYVISLFAVKERTHAYSKELRALKKLPHEERQRGFMVLYQKLETSIGQEKELDYTPAKLREAVQKKFFPEKDRSRFAIMFLDEQQQRVRLYEEVLQFLTSDLVSLMGAKQVQSILNKASEDSLLRGIIVTDSGLEFLKAESIFYKLPEQWMRLVYKSFDDLVNYFVVMVRQTLGEAHAGKTYMKVSNFLQELAPFIPQAYQLTYLVPGDKRSVISVTNEARVMLRNIGLLSLTTQGFVENVESEIVTKAGKTLPVTVSASALRDDKGAISGMVITAKDMSEIQKLQKEKLALLNEAKVDLERKVEERTKSLRNAQEATLNVLDDVEDEKHKASQERDKVNTILQSIGDGVFVIDTNYRITLFNHVAEQISGFSAKEAINKKYEKVLRFIREGDEKRNDGFLKDAMEQGVVAEMENHTLLIRKDGKKVSVADSAAPLKDLDGRILGVVVVFRDITREREVDRAKTEFVSLASHQLKTPLTAVKWYSELLLSEDAGSVSKKQRKYLNEVQHGNQRMIELVNALLNVSRIELGTFVIEPEQLDLKAVFESVLKELSQPIKTKKLTVKKQYDKTLSLISLDPNIIRIIVQNLLSNAVKYTPENGTVSISVTKRKSDILIEVADTGYGIPASQQQKIFTKLFRADNVRKRDTDGTGLGLYIVKSVIEQSGGTIWFESEENKGTTFFVTIPLEGMTRQEGPKSLVGDARSRNKKINKKDK